MENSELKSLAMISVTLTCCMILTSRMRHCNTHNTAKVSMELISIVNSGGSIQISESAVEAVKRSRNVVDNIVASNKGLQNCHL